MRASLLVLFVGLVGCGVPMPSNDAGAPSDGLDSGAADAGSDADAGSTACGSDVAPADGVVVTTGGAFHAAKQGEVYRWLGMPYVKAPVGALRWRPPEPVECTPGVREATAFGPVCPQRLADGGVVGAEDCLTINVFAKGGLNNAPVMVWVHGGGNVQGSGTEPTYEGQELAARQGVVVVTLNYRLGALGYFTHASLNAESDAGVSGNYGILDQQAALRWVRDNVRAFGGDPSHVLLFGESAGGQNTLIHLVAPGSKGLFSSAIAESGGTYNTTLAQSLVALQPVVQGSGCTGASNVLECMRGVSASSLAAIDSAEGPLAKGMRYVPVIDGVVLPDNPVELVKQGKQHGVPVILGTNADETSRMVTPVTTDAEYQAAVRAQYGTALGNQVLTQYPSSRFSSPRAALIAVTTDATWTCAMRRLARSMARTQTAPVYRYFFTWRSPGPAGALIGSTHGLEIPFVFRTFSSFGGFTPDANALALSDSMQQYWSSFAATGTPAGSVAWPRFPTDNTDAALELNTTIAPMTGVRTADCDFIDSLIP